MKVYPEPATDDIFGRQYLLSNTVWSNASAPGTLVSSVNLPVAFASFDVLQKKLADYMYTRMDVELEVKLVCSRYHYGAVMVSRSYGRAEDDTWYPWTMDWRQRAQMDAVVLACGDKQACKVVMKWNLPTVFMTNVGWGSQIGSLYVHVLHQLASVEPNPPNTVTVQIYGRIVNLRLAGPDQYGGPPLQKGLPHKRIEQQSKKHGGTQQDEAAKKSREGVLTQVAEATAQIAPHLARLPLIGGVASMVGDVAGMASPVLRALGWCKPTDVSKPQPFLPHLPQFMTQTAGVDPALRMCERPDELISLHESTAPFKDWAPSVNQYVRRFGFVEQGVWAASDTLGTALLTIPVSPWYCADKAPSGSPQTTTVIPTPLAYMSQYFGYCRGSIRYAIFICGNSFIGGVLRITYSPSTTFPVVMENYGGDYISKLVTVQGPTWVYFTVPRQNNNVWSSLKGGPKLGVTLPERPYGANVVASSTVKPSDVAKFGALRITVVEPLVVTSTTANPVVYFTVFQAAGKDWQFARYCGRDSVTLTTYQLAVPPPIVEKHAALADLEDADFPGLQEISAIERDDGLVFPDRDVSFVELMHRYSEGEWAQTTAATTRYLDIQPFQRGATWNVYYEDAIAELSMIFRYWRGSIRWFVRSISTTNDTLLMWYIPKWETPFLMEDQGASGCAIDSTGQRGARGYTTIECPWSDTRPYAFVYYDSPANGDRWTLGILPAQTGEALWLAVGDDFGMSGSLPPPMINYRTNAAPTLADKRPAKAGQVAHHLGQTTEDDLLQEIEKRREEARAMFNRVKDLQTQLEAKGVGKTPGPS
jgi:hypothetical protein